MEMQSHHDSAFNMLALIFIIPPHFFNVDNIVETNAKMNIIGLMNEINHDVNHELRSSP